MLIAAIQSGDADRAGVIRSLFKTPVERRDRGQLHDHAERRSNPAPISVSQAADTFTLAKTISPLPQLVAAARG